MFLGVSFSFDLFFYFFSDFSIPLLPTANYRIALSANCNKPLSFQQGREFFSVLIYFCYPHPFLTNWVPDAKVGTKKRLVNEYLYSFLRSYFKPEAAALSFFALYMQRAAVLLQQFSAYDKPQSTALFAGGALARMMTVKAEKVLYLFVVHAYSGIGNGYDIFGGGM